MRTRKDIRIRFGISRLKNKRAQEEIVGFVAIVLIISIILTIVLGFMIRKNTQLDNQSTEYYQFLESMLQYTTPCAISFEPAYLRLGELLQVCNSGLSVCTNGDTPCNVTEDIVNSILKEVFLSVSDDSAIKGYEFISYYTLDDKTNEIIKIKKGNCTGSYQGAEKLNPSYPGTISTTIKVCN